MYLYKLNKRGFPDTVAHPLLGPLGCMVGHIGGTPGEQARNFLRSLREATIYQIAGRRGPDLSAAEYQGWLQQLDAWEAAGNQVVLPPPNMPASFPKALPPATPNVDNTLPASFPQLQKNIAAARDAKPDPNLINPPMGTIPAPSTSTKH